MKMNKIIIQGSSRCGTTITRDILSAHPKIWLTNELRVFCDKNPSKRVIGPCLYADTAEEYFTALKDKVIKGEGPEYHKFPPGFDFNKMVELCLAHLKEDTLEGRLDAVLSALAGKNDFEWFGDKQARLNVLIKMYELGINYKLIVIYRDGRDVAASGVRHKRGLSPPWSNNPVENADHWATVFEEQFPVLEKIDPSMYVLIRFEDYILKPDKNFELIGELLGVDPNEFDKTMFNKAEAHMGYYTKWCPDWEQTFTDRSKAMLKRLGYI
jgi:hypothetical protein